MPVLAPERREGERVQERINGAFLTEGVGEVGIHMGEFSAIDVPEGSLGGYDYRGLWLHLL